VLAHPTDGIGFGGLLQTPTTTERCEDPKEMRARAERNGYKNGTQYNGLTSQVVYGLLPTVKTFDANGQRQLDANGQNVSTTTGRKYGVHLVQMAASQMLPTPRVQSANAPGIHGRGGMDLQTTVVIGMLPTPNAMDWNTARSKEAHARAKEQHGSALQDTLRQRAGQGSQLNPRFVAEMMGFPVNWTELPFQSGEPSQSKPTATP
jgi:hypothetical protein